MLLKLKNIGMIKEAEVKIDGLTVIAGENDTGKSTVGKALYFMIKNINEMLLQADISYSFIEIFKEDNFLQKDGYLSLKTNKNEYYINSYFSTDLTNQYKESDDSSLDPIFIETPLIWHFTDFFRDVAQIESQLKIKLDYPYLMKELNFKLHIKKTLSEPGINIKNEIAFLIGGNFRKNEIGHYYFDKKGQKVELVNTATGIKSFGILQVLSQNNYLNKNTVLILDEPEVHLHPKWQLKYAKLITMLVKKGVKVLVNSHSPYMIEALKRYSEINKIENKTNFYIAKNGYIKQIENSNYTTLSKIFEILSEPFEEFDKMDAQKIENE